MQVKNLHLIVWSFQRSVSTVEIKIKVHVIYHNLECVLVILLPCLEWKRTSTFPPATYDSRYRVICIHCSSKWVQLWLSSLLLQLAQCLQEDHLEYILLPHSLFMLAFLNPQVYKTSTLVLHIHTLVHKSQQIQFQKTKPPKKEIVKIKQQNVKFLSKL